MKLFPAILTASVLLRVGLILYSEWHDSHSLVKYTDVDYRVFSDAASFLLHPGPDSQNHALGPLSGSMGLSGRIGNPYNRDTYRYTPLLAILMLPNAFFPSFGKILFALCDILNGLLIRKMLLSTILPRVYSQSNKKPTLESMTYSANIYSAIYLLNPMVFSISTRGSSEAILSLGVLSTLYAALRNRWDQAALLLGLTTHWKIYPFIYGFSCLTAILGSSKSFTIASFVKMARFGILSAGTFLLLGAICYSIWGTPFIEHTYTYHLHRQDHRHNFSPHFYLIYLTYDGDSPDASPFPWLYSLVRSPFLSFIPQLVLSTGASIISLWSTEDLDFAWFIQTAVFVIFNKVCTSQYFLWYLHFLPLLCPRLQMKWRTATVLGLVWVGSQVLWLAEAYNLEFLGQSVFLSLWLRSLIYLVSHSVVLVKIMQSYKSRANTYIHTKT